MLMSDELNPVLYSLFDILM